MPVALLTLGTACSAGAGSVEPTATTVAPTTTTTTVAPTTTTTVPAVPTFGASVDQVVGRWNAAATALGSGLIAAGDSASGTIREGGLRVRAWGVGDRLNLELTVAPSGEVARIDVVQHVRLAGEGSELAMLQAIAQAIMAADPDLPPAARGEIATELIQADEQGEVDRVLVMGAVRYRLFTGHGELTFYAEPIS